MITYNHEDFIADAIESVLMQEVDFDFELIIGEDESSDRTREIVKHFHRRYPDRIRLVLNDRSNVVYAHGRPTGNGNLVKTLEHARGKYIALLEGDDYWTSSRKLQRQVDFLDNNPSCAIVHHAATKLLEDGIEEPQRRPPQKTFATLEDLLRFNFIRTCSVMYRNGLFSEFPDWFYKLPMGDRPLYILILNAQNGQIGYIDETMAVYRRHGDSATSAWGYSGGLYAQIALYETINPHLNYRYDSLIQKRLEELWKRLAVVKVEEGVQRGMNGVDLDNVSAIFNDRPEEIPHAVEWERAVLSDIYERLLFTFHGCDEDAARYCWWRLLQFSPQKLRNHGVLSIGLKNVLFGSMLNRLRRSYND